MNPSQAEHVSVREIDGQFLVLDKSHGKLHELNPTASFIWQCCDGRTTVPEIAGRLSLSFDTDPETASRDVASILRQFEENHLIRWTPVPEPYSA